MAIGTKSDFKIYDDQFFGGMSEVIEQNSNAFNAASNGAIVLQPERLIGDFEKESFIKSISGLVSRRNIASVSAAADLAVVQGENVAVKINRKIGPVAQTLDAFRKIGMSVDAQTLSFMLGEQVGKAVMTDYINTAVLGARAALNATTAVLHDYSATGTITHGQMVVGMSKLGDASSRIAAFVMHSKPYHDLMGQAIADKVYEVAGAAIYGGTVATFGRPVVVLDAPALMTSGTPNKYDTLGLVPEAVTVRESEERTIENQIITGLENLVVRMQGEYAFSLGVKGYTWDVTNGGVNPDDTALALGTNWDQTATDKRSLAGIIIKTQ
ncbi:major capsid protein [Immundisolibacter sp.]